MGRTTDLLDDSSDDEPLTKFLKKPRETDKQNGTQTRRLVDTSDDEHDEPPTKMVKSLSAKRPGTNNTGSSNDIQKTTKFSGSNHDGDSDDSSDDEPLIKKVRKPPGTVEKTISPATISPANAESHHTDSSGDCSDDEPLIKMVSRLKTQTKTPVTTARKTPTIEECHSSDHDENSDDSSDDEPLIKKVGKPPGTVEKTTSPVTISPANAESHHTGSNHDENSDDSSDDEPLINKVRKPPGTVEKTTSPTIISSSQPLKMRPANTISHHTDTSGDCSDDEPLIKMVSRLKTRTKTPVTTARKTPTIEESHSKAPKPPNRNRLIESSDDSSDDEPLIKMTRSSTAKENLMTILERCVAKEVSERHASDSCKDQTSREEEEDSDYEPLIKRVKKPSKAVKKTATPVPRKTVTPKSRGRKKPDRKSLKVALNTSEGSSDECSDDEPLIKLVGKASKAAKKTVIPGSRKRPDMVKKIKTPIGAQNTSKGPSTDSSDDEPLSKLVRKSPATKTLMVVLERCINEVVLVNNFSVDLRNTGKRSAGEENSADVLSSKMDRDPLEASPEETLVEKRQTAEDSSDDEPLIKMVVKVS